MNLEKEQLFINKLKEFEFNFDDPIQLAGKIRDMNYLQLIPNDLLINHIMKFSDLTIENQKLTERIQKFKKMSPQNTECNNCLDIIEIWNSKICFCRNEYCDKCVLTCGICQQSLCNKCMIICKTCNKKCCKKNAMKLTKPFIAINYVPVVNVIIHYVVISFYVIIANSNFRHNVLILINHQKVALFVPIFNFLF